MKRIICILLMLLMNIPALAEEIPAAEAGILAPFAVTVPEEVTVEDSEGACTFIHGQTRVVAIRIERVPDADPAGAVIRMMGQYDPAAVIGEDLPAAEGFTALEAATPDKFGDGVDALTVMILSHEGELLILSGYDMSGSEVHVRALLDTLLAGLTSDGKPVILKNE